jgi:glycosyltransferase involved in cell wall biosynthesis
MGQTPIVSVVIPTYGRRALVTSALESVVSQTLRDYEIIVVDDSSPDDTGAVLRPYVERNVARYVRQPHRGVAAARNRGVREARGEFLAFLDDDDLWPPDKLEWQLEALGEHPEAGLVYGFMESFGTERPYRWPPPDAPSGWVREAFLTGNWIRSPGQTLIRRAAFEAAKGFDESLRGAEDWDFYLRLSKDWPFVYWSRPALRYRAHAGNASKQAFLMYRCACRVHRRHAGAIPLPGSARAWLQCRWSIVNFCWNELNARRRSLRADRGLRLL